MGGIADIIEQAECLESELWVLVLVLVFVLYSLIIGSANLVPGVGTVGHFLIPQRAPSIVGHESLLTGCIILEN